MTSTVQLNGVTQMSSFIQTTKFNTRKQPGDSPPIVAGQYLRLSGRTWEGGGGVHFRFSNGLSVRSLIQFETGKYKLKMLNKLTLASDNNIQSQLARLTSAWGHRHGRKKNNSNSIPSRYDVPDESGGDWKRNGEEEEEDEDEKIDPQA